MAGRINDEDIAAVRERARIDEIVGAYVTLRHAGSGSLKGLCPFHDEKTPSFHVTPARQFFYCFGCGEGGDVITFVQKIDQLGFTEAVELLADKVGIRLRYDDGAAAAPRDPGQRSRLVRANRIAAEFYADQLFSAAEAVTGRQFLDSRGFDTAAAEKFGVGYAPRGGEALVSQLRANGVQQADMITAGLAAEGRSGPYDRFRGRLLWPIRDAGGEVIGFGARRLFDDDRIEAKYLNTPETPIYKKSKVLYGVDLARREIARASQAVVVEGYTDVMACHLAGVPTAVASCGTAFGDDHARVLRNLLLDHDQFRGEVIFAFDSDKAGQDAALKAYGGDQAFVGQTYVAVEPDGLDPCELWLRKGAAAVRELVARRIPLYRFVLGSVLARFDLDRADGRVDALRAAAPLVVSVRDRSKADAYARELAGRLGMDQEEVRAEIHRAAARPRRERRRAIDASLGTASVDRLPDDRGGDGAVEPADETPARQVPSPREPRFAVEWGALKLITQHPQLIGDGFDDLDERDFTHPWLADIWQAMKKAGGPAQARSGETWVLTVRDNTSIEQGPAVLAALAVEPLRLDRAPDAALVAAHLARVQEFTCLRAITELKSRLQRTSPVDAAEEYNRMFGELIALERHRVQLREAAIGGAL